MPEAQLPAAVQRQVDAANKLASDIGMKNAPPVETPRPPAEAPPPPSGASGTAAAADPPPSAASSAPEGSPQGASNVTPIDWERRYRALKGQFDAEMPRMRQQVEALQLQLASAQDALNRIQTAPPAPAGHAPAPNEPWYTPEMVEGYGQEFFDIIDRRVSQVEQTYGNAVTQLRDENKTLREELSRIGGTVQQAQTQPLLQQLDSMVPGWRDLNTDPAFLEWGGSTPVSHLDDTDMLTAMRKLFARGKVNGVAEIFQTYLKTQGQGQAPGQVQHSPPASMVPHVGGVTPNALSRVSLDSLAGPGAPQEARVDPLASGNVSQRVWTDRTIADFYDGVRRGQYTPQEAASLEADLQQAISAQGRAIGRYRPR